MALDQLRLTALPASVRAALSMGDRVPVIAAEGTLDARPFEVRAMRAALELHHVGHDEPVCRIDIDSWTEEAWGDQSYLPTAETGHLSLNLAGGQLIGRTGSDKQPGGLRKGRLNYWRVRDTAGGSEWCWLLHGNSTRGVTELRRSSPAGEPVVTMVAGKPPRTFGPREVRILCADAATDREVLVAAMLCTGGFEKELVSRNEMIGRAVKWWIGGKIEDATTVRPGDLTSDGG